MRPAGPPLSDWSWRWLSGLPAVSVIDIQNRRDAFQAVARVFAPTGMGPGIQLAPLAAGGTPRPRTRHEVDLFRWVTEGRPWGNKAYSTCVDGAMGMKCALGFRDERMLNRIDDNIDGIDDPRFPPSEPPTQNDRPSQPAVTEWWDVAGTKAWKSGWNVTMFHQGSISLGTWVDAKSGRLPQIGDDYLVDYGTGLDHVASIFEGPEEIRPGVYRYLTIEAGQVDGGGQCFQVYETHHSVVGKQVVMDRQASPAGPAKRRILHGFSDFALLPLAAAALLPPGCEIGSPV